MAAGDQAAAEKPQRTEASRRAQHLAALCHVLFTRLKHLHGLTKPCGKLVKVAAAVVAGRKAARQNSHSSGRHLLIGLKPRERRLVRMAVNFDRLRDEEAWQASRQPSNKKLTALGIAARMAAIVQLAEGLDHSRTRATLLRGVDDNGETVTLYVHGGIKVQDDVEAARARLHLWNEVALRPIADIEVGEPPAEQRPLVTTDDTTAAAGRRIMLRQFEQLLAREYGAGDSDDVEFVHEMRVAIRRLRAAMRVFAKAFGGKLAAASAKLRESADVLGKARDADVFLEFLEDVAGHDRQQTRWFLKTLIRNEKRARRRHYVRLRDVLRGRRHRKFMDELYASLLHPQAADVSPSGLTQPVIDGARRALRRNLKRVLSFGRDLEMISDDDQHQLRIACKKLRYTAEFFAALYPAELERLQSSMEQLQELLGQAHDADVYIRRLSQYYKRRRKKGTARAAKALQLIRRQLRRRKARFLSKAAAAWKRFLAPPFQAELRQRFRRARPA